MTRPDIVHEEHLNIHVVGYPPSRALRQQLLREGKALPERKLFTWRHLTTLSPPPSSGPSQLPHPPPSARSNPSGPSSSPSSKATITRELDEIFDQLDAFYEAKDRADHAAKLQESTVVGADEKLEADAAASEPSSGVPSDDSNADLLEKLDKLLDELGDFHLENAQDSHVEQLLAFHLEGRVDEQSESDSLELLDAFQKSDDNLNSSTVPVPQDN